MRRSPETITEPGTGAGFHVATPTRPIPRPNDGRLYVYATRLTDDTGGVVCVETTLRPQPDPFCGFTELTG